ncbi:energy transducer TonB [Rhodoferax sp.]|uniref:energy transducer TonB n=1 Tax=Rhodoferax sp. TaxID=50421 RepID=UPI0025EC4C42|nr:TonB family protein [Rhodoferax sp.]
MKSYIARGVWAAVAAVLVGCASAPPEAPWPEQQVNIDDMVTTSPWVAKIPLPAVDLVRDRSRNSTVVLEADVAADGTVQRTRVAQTSYNALLDEAALLSLRELRFVPYRENGVALPVTVVAPMTFKFYDRPR